MENNRPRLKSRVSFVAAAAAAPGRPRGRQVVSAETAGGLRGAGGCLEVALLNDERVAFISPCHAARDGRSPEFR